MWSGDPRPGGRSASWCGPGGGRRSGVGEAGNWGPMKELGAISDAQRGEEPAPARQTRYCGRLRWRDGSPCGEEAVFPGPDGSGLAMLGLWPE
ncbi:hypothetical protein NDU88_002629 [Pleurodeles waltl]|uniref:Uncharacterized protein n=1 Tax=Pleurodeles waltl TaxID=8319 RepID=A0AAV7VE73_PLEWA|nr:hypothetical protein NDU88_002629 [Pleurodeles waltl]